MKLNAMERSTVDDRDFRDAAKLASACGVSTAEGLRDIFQEFFPGEELPPATQLRLGELERAIASQSKS